MKIVRHKAQRIVSHIVLAALISTTVTPTHAGVLDLVRSDEMSIVSGILLTCGTLIGALTYCYHEGDVQNSKNKFAVRNALNAIVERLEQSKNNENPVDVSDQLKELKESFPVYTTVYTYSPPIMIFDTNGRISSSVGIINWHSVFTHYAISNENIKNIRKACNYFNRNIDKEDQLETIRVIQDRLKTEHIPTEEQLESGKRFRYHMSAAFAGVGATGLLASLYLKYAQK